MIRFFHLADIHLGSWRENKLKKLNFKSFETTINNAIEQKINFILISGDLFDVPLPTIDLLNDTVKLLNKLKETNIDIYAIGGSHDYSFSRSSFLETFDLLKVINLVSKKSFQSDSLFITGISGEKKSLDSKKYLNYVKDYTKFKDCLLKIFMFHINVKDVTKLNYDGINKGDLPTGFNYYAGGHIHKRIVQKNKIEKLDLVIAYPGALFPNNFKELIDDVPGYLDINYNDVTKKIDVKEVVLDLYQKKVINILLEDETVESFRRELLNKIEIVELQDKILLIELSGIVDGKISDIRINEIVEGCYEKGAYIVLKNLRKLKPKELIIEDNNELDVDNFIEKEIENLSKYENDSTDKKIINNIFNENFEKHEDETNVSHEERVINVLDTVFNKNS